MNKKETDMKSKKQNKKAIIESRQYLWEKE